MVRYGHGLCRCTHSDDDAAAPWQYLTLYKLAVRFLLNVQEALFLLRLAISCMPPCKKIRAYSTSRLPLLSSGF